MLFYSIAVAFVCTSANALSDVRVMNTKTFQEETKEGFWLLEFYAPWCGHCKKLNPILDEISSDALQKGMHIGKIDTTVEKNLSEVFKIKGYPTLKFRVAAAEEWRTYEGGRKAVDLLAFADRMQSPPLAPLTSEDDVSHVLSLATEAFSGVAFVFGGEGKDWETTATTTARAVQHKSYCGFLDPSKSLSWPPQGSGTVPAVALPVGRPFVAAIEDGEQPRLYDGTLDGVGEAGVSAAIEAWMASSDAPLVSNISVSNFRKLGKLGKLFAVAVVDPSNATTAPYLAGLTEIARGMQKVSDKTLRDKFVFGYLDGVKWKEFIEQFNIFNGELPRLVVLDAPKEIFFEDPSVDEVDEIETFLREVYAGKVPAQREGGDGFMGFVNRFIAKAKSLGWVLPLMLVPFIAMVAAACMGPPKDDYDKEVKVD